jgi:hypothetical protein
VAVNAADPNATAQAIALADTGHVRMWITIWYSFPLWSRHPAPGDRVAASRDAIDHPRPVKVTTRSAHEKPRTATAGFFFRV